MDIYKCIPHNKCKVFEHNCIKSVQLLKLVKAIFCYSEAQIFFSVFVLKYSYASTPQKSKKTDARFDRFNT